MDNHVIIVFATTNFPDKNFRRSANFVKYMEYLAHPSDWGCDEIHAEIIVNSTSYSAVGIPPEPCVIISPFKLCNYMQPFVECVMVPVKDVNAAQNILEDLAKTHATYWIPILDFMVPSIFLKDLDLNPEHWQHLYCSQFVLLSLRKMAIENLLDVPIHKQRILFDSCVSKTCTPTHLKRIISKMLQ